MKKMNLIMAAAIGVFALSCDNDVLNTPEVNTDPISVEAEEVVLKEATIDNSLETADYEVDYFTANAPELNDGLKSADGRRYGLRYAAGQAPDVTIDTAATGFPKTVTLDYGEGTELENGKILSGKIIIVVTGPRMQDGSMRTVTFEEFFVDSINIKGSTKNTYYAGTDEDTGEFTYKRKLYFIFPDESEVERQGDITRKWLQGLSTRHMHADDIIEISGTASSVDRKGNTYSREIAEPLVKTGACRFITEGIVRFSFNDEVMYLNYGNGQCDYTAELTKNGETKEINLARWNKKRN